MTKGDSSDSVANLPRQRLLMDPQWRFCLGSIEVPALYEETYLTVKTGRAQGAAAPDFDDSGWEVVDLPHDWVVAQPFDPHSDVSHGFKPVGIGWYRKTFVLPASDEGRHLSLEFDGVFRDSTVWLNGHLLGNHPSGYTSFRYDITDVANYGGENIVVVRVNATECEGWWYEGGGIYRHVWLIKTDPLHIPQWGTFVTATPDRAAEPEQAAIVLRTVIENDYYEDKSCELVSTVADAEGNEVAAVQSQGVISAGESCEFTQSVVVDNPQLWSLGRPYLYRVLTTVKAGGRVVDSYETTFGIRTIKFDPDKGFFLNGESLKIKGTCNHQDHAGVGIALPDRINEYRIERLKAMGANAYRCAHNPPTPELLDTCDRLGMLVMDENRYLSSTAEHLADLESLIRRDRNHPSIIMWSLANEEPIQGTLVGSRIAKTMIRLIHKLDTTRPITCAMNDAWGSALSHLLDIQGCNYRPEKYDAYHQEYPKHPVIATETSSATTTRGIYAKDEQKGYMSAYDVNSPDWGQTAKDAWQAVAERPWMSGTFVWTGFDYRGEPTPYKWPCINSHFGSIDTCGFPKDNYYYYRSWWSDEMVLHILPHWNWPGHEGEEIQVWCYSNYDEVELLLNGNSLGRQTMPRYGCLKWPVEYAPGTLSAQGYKVGKVVAEVRVATTGPATRIELTPDRSAIKANGEDVAIVTVSIVDAEGRIVPTADDDVSFAVSENARIIGVGNGNPSSHEPDKANRRRTFNGLAQVIVQAGQEAGEIVLTAGSPGLLPARLVIPAEVSPVRPFVPAVNRCAQP